MAIIYDKQNILKNLKPDEAQIHKTVKNQEILINEIPENCPYWIIKVETQVDEQIFDRQLNLWCDDESLEYQKACRNMLLKIWGKTSKPMTEFNTNSKTCRIIWDCIGTSEIYVPFGNRIVGNLNEPRTLNLLAQLICASALMHSPKRDKDPEENRITATEEDFYIAAGIINPLLSNEKGSQLLGLSKSQIEIIKALETLGSGTYSTKMIVSESGLSDSQVSRAINGYKFDSNDGLLKICPVITKATQTTSDSRNNLETRNSRKAYDWNSEAYKRWIGRLYGPFTLKDLDI